MGKTDERKEKKAGVEEQLWICRQITKPFNYFEEALWTAV